MVSSRRSSSLTPGTPVVVTGIGSGQVANSFSFVGRSLLLLTSNCICTNLCQWMRSKERNSAHAEIQKVDAATRSQTTMQHNVGR